MARTAKEAAKFLADQSVAVARVAATYDDKPSISIMRDALIRRSEVIMDCAKMIADWDK